MHLFKNSDSLGVTFLVHYVDTMQAASHANPG